MGQLEWLHVKEILHYQLVHLTSLLLLGTFAFLLEHLLH